MNLNKVAAPKKGPSVVSKKRYDDLRVAALDAVRLFVKLEEASAVRFPFQDYRPVVNRLRKELGLPST